MKNKPLQLFILKSETPNNLSIDPLYRIYDVCLKDMIFIKSFLFWIFVSIFWIKTRQERNKITGKLSRALIDQDSHRANQWRLTGCPEIPWYTGHLNRYWQGQGSGWGNSVLWWRQTVFCVYKQQDPKFNEYTLFKQYFIQYSTHVYWIGLGSRHNPF